MTDLMSQGVNLALLGMGTVFFFLTLLVGVTMVMSALIPGEEGFAVNEPAAARVDSRIHAAIAAAVFQHRKKNRRH